LIGNNINSKQLRAKNKKVSKGMHYYKIFNIIEFWFLSLIIIFPVVLALCKSSNNGDTLNKLVAKNGGE